MKKLNLLLFVLCVAGGFLFTSCGDKEDPVTIEFTLNTDKLEFQADETGSKQVNVTTNAEDFNPTCEELWVEVNKNNNGFTVAVKEFTEEQAGDDLSRKATIKVTATGTSIVREVTVTQYAPGVIPDPKYSIEVDVEEVRYDADGALKGDAVTVTTDAPAIIVTIPAASQEMITAGKVEAGKLVLTVSENTTDGEREGTVVLTAQYSEDEITIDVIQDKKAAPDPEYTIEVDMEEVRYDADGNLVGAQLTVTTDAPAVTVDVPSGSIVTSGTITDGKLVLVVSNNTTANTRTAEIKLTAEYAEDVTVAVLQGAAETLGFEKQFGVDAFRGLRLNDDLTQTDINPTTVLVWDGFEKAYFATQVVNTENGWNLAEDPMWVRIDIDPSKADGAKGQLYIEMGKAFNRTVTVNGAEVELYNWGTAFDQETKTLVEVTEGARWDMFQPKNGLDEVSGLYFLASDLEDYGDNGRYIPFYFAAYKDGGEWKPYTTRYGNLWYLI